MRRKVVLLLSFFIMIAIWLYLSGSTASAKSELQQPAPFQREERRIEPSSPALQQPHHDAIFDSKLSSFFFEPSIPRDVQVAEGFDLKNIYSPYREFQIAANKARNLDFTKCMVKHAESILQQQHPDTTVKFSFAHWQSDPIVGQHVTFFFAHNKSSHFVLELDRRFEAQAREPPTVWPVTMAEPLYLLVTVTIDKLDPLGRLTDFLASFAAVHRLHICVVLVTAVNNEKEDSTKVKTRLASAHVPVTIFTRPPPYRRAAAIQHGVEELIRLHGNPKVFVADADVLFVAEFLVRCRYYAIQNRIYFPVLFSMYHQAKELRLADGNGQWRVYGSGMFCLQANDFMRLGGMDQSIDGWGLEDLRFFEAALRDRSTTVVRAVDKSLVHQWHAKHCPDTLTDAQMKSCKASMMEYEGNKQQLAHQLLTERKGAL
eukprot:TRINITY_DN8478_c0_g1_i1.p1 TRINITY_DN8478_c0_g1~~TRINITY_DN8478_c0_g1_i1.p1  ORF type:complete len:430 (+),score=94.92 TRINITY_DN8478_c0_g1_i1:178-1467(+)